MRSAGDGMRAHAWPRLRDAALTQSDGVPTDAASGAAAEDVPGSSPLAPPHPESSPTASRHDAPRPDAPRDRAPMPFSEASQLAHLLRVLGDVVRIRILSIAATEPDGLSVGDFVRELDVQQPTVSHHLRILTDAGFLEVQRHGTRRIYRAVPAALSAVAEAVRPER